MKHRTPEKQKAYYEQTATQYHEMHVGAGDEHFRALHYIAAISELRGLSSFLDVGSGTGRAVHFLHSKGFDVKGVEPVEALIDQAFSSKAHHVWARGIVAISRWFLRCRVRVWCAPSCAEARGSSRGNDARSAQSRFPI